MRRFGTWLVYAFAFVLGIVPAFVVGAAVFADGPPLLSLKRILPVFIAYSIVSFIFSLIVFFIRVPIGVLSLAIWLSLLGVLMVLVMGKDIGGELQGLYMLVVWVTTLLGSYAGRSLAFRLKGK